VSLCYSGAQQPPCVGYPQAKRSYQRKLLSAADDESRLRTIQQALVKIESGSGGADTGT
jgi:hypothetical protein